MMVLMIFIAVITAVIIGIFLKSGNIMKNTEKLLSAIPKGAVVSVGALHQNSIRDGVQEWSLDASSAHYIQESRQAQLVNLSAVFFLKGERHIHLKADQGILQTESKNIEVNGNVIITNDGYSLETGDIVYENGKRVLYSNTPVKLTGMAFDLVADSVYFDLNTNRTLFEGNIQGTINETMQFN